MTEPEPLPSIVAPTSEAGNTRFDWLLIGVLVALVLPLRAWLLYNTEVTARDSIGYIRYARDFEIARTGLPAPSPGTKNVDEKDYPKSWIEVVNKHHQHPGYSVCVWAMSVPVSAVDGAMTPENMALSAQLVNFIAALVLIVPMYFSGRQFFGRSISFLGALLYQYLPVSAQHLSDAISEPVYLVFLSSALLFAFRGVRSRDVRDCALCGLFTGLGYLTRPEGLLVLPAFFLVLAATQCLAAYRCAWPRFARAGAAMLLTTMAVGSIYVYATGKISNKPTVKVIGEQKFLAAQGSAARATPLLAVTFPETSDRGLRLMRSCSALVVEVNQGFHYVAGIPMLLGLWWSFSLLRANPAYWMMMTFGCVHGLILVALAMSVHYVSDRHVMIVVMGWTYFAVYGLQELPRRVLGWITTDTATDAAASGWRTWVRSSTVWFGILFVALIAFCLPKSTHRIHGNRVGNHEAGLWLAQHYKTGDHLEDDHNWSEFYARVTFREYEVPILPKDYVPTCYVVMTRSRDPQVNAERTKNVVSPQASIAYVWPEGSDLEKARVVVFAQPRDPARNPWTVEKSDAR